LTGPVYFVGADLSGNRFDTRPVQLR
jgi:hypothetical protein